jgi:hypothetical protein
VTVLEALLLSSAIYQPLPTIAKRDDGDKVPRSAKFSEGEPAAKSRNMNAA